MISFYKQKLNTEINTEMIKNMVNMYTNNLQEKYNL